MKFNPIATSMALAAGLALSASVQAAPITLLIDDFKFTTSTSVTAPPASTQVFASRDNTPGNGSWLGSRTSIYAHTMGLATVTTRDCAACEAGTFNSDSATTGHGFWGWSVPAFDMTPYDQLVFQYMADLPGGDLVISFWSGTDLAAKYWYKEMPSTLGDFVEKSVGVSGIIVDATKAQSVTQIFVDILGVEGTYTDPSKGFARDVGLGEADYGNGRAALDFEIRNLRLEREEHVPEPATLALLGLGLVGLGALRRRRG